MIVGIHTIIVQTTDMDRSVAFYRDVLKLKSEYASPYWSSFDLGSARLGVHPVFEDNSAPSIIPFKNAIVGVEAEDIGVLRAALEAAGDFVHGEYHDTPGGVVLNFLDPDGNNWQAIQPGKKAKDLSS